jgi:transposase
MGMTLDALPLPDDLATCQRMIRELLASLHDARNDNEQLRHRLDLLLRRIYGPRAERFDPNQPLLFTELPAAPAPPPPAAASAPDQPASRSRGHGRQRLPGNLPRRRIVHDIVPAERVCPGCGQQRTPIGEEVSEQLDYQPASLFIVEHARCKYACPHCQEHVIVADKPAQPIDKGLPGPGLLAHVAVSKYLDHLPLHRLERIFSRQGIDLSRSTLCDWMAAAARLLLPLAEMLRVRVLQSRVIHTDDTPVPVLEDRRGSTRQARLWVYLGDRDHPYTVYDYTPTHARDGPVQFLGEYHGYLQADAFAGYDGIYATGRVEEVACWAHARRKFYDARSSDVERSHAALAWIRRLYDVEDQAKSLTDAERCALRQAEAVPLLTAICQWLTEQRQAVLPKSPMGQAISYALSNWQALCRYTETGFLAIDNNAAERALRGIAIGRKNWLFCGSDNGGRTAAILASVLASCQRQKLDPFVYLRDVLTRLPEQPADRLDDFLPDRWAMTSLNVVAPETAPAPATLHEPLNSTAHLTEN